MVPHSALRCLFLGVLVVSVAPEESARQFYDPNQYDPQQEFGPQNFRPPLSRPSRPPYDGPPQDFGPYQPFGRPGRPQDNGPPPGFDQDIYDPQDFGPQGPQGPPGYRPQGIGPQGYRPQGYRPNPNNPYTFPGLSALNPLGGIGNALESIARYDDKKCVARMLCEVSAGGRPGGYRADSGFFDLSALRGIAELMGAMTESPAASPMLMFGRAALLGATMRDPYRCYSSYPQCPRDPDRLVDYLNNHNGGFFKLFNQQAAASDNSQAGNYGNSGYPTRRPPYRRGKKLRKDKYPQSDPNEANDPNVHIQNDVPLTDRTGTGELRLDTEQLESTRAGKTLRFPRQHPQETPARDTEQASGEGGKAKIVFPTP